MFGFIVAGIFFLFADIVWWGNLRRGERVGMVSRSRRLIGNLKEKWHSVVDMYRISCAAATKREEINKNIDDNSLPYHEKNSAE